MPLIECPDCGRAISTLAPVCIGCGRPMKPDAGPYANAAAEPPAVPTADVPTATPPEPGMPYAEPPLAPADPGTQVHAPALVADPCPACGSPDMAPVPWVYERGPAALRAAMDWSQAGFPASPPDARPGDADLVRRLAPPAPRDEERRPTTAEVYTTAAVVALAALLGWRIAGPGGAVGFAATAILAAPVIYVVILGNEARWNRGTLPRLLAAWKASRVCLACGTVVAPDTP